MKWLDKFVEIISLGRDKKPTTVTDPKQQTRELIQYSLACLNKRNDIVETLYDLYMTGTPNSDAGSPIVKWLKKTTGINVLLRHDYINDSIEIKHNDDVYGFFEFRKISEFLIKFDDEQYPQLLDKHFTNQINSAVAL